MNSGWRSRCGLNRLNLIVGVVGVLLWAFLGSRSTISRSLPHLEEDTSRDDGVLTGVELAPLP